MKTMIISGSPRKDWNTEILLQDAQRGVLSEGVETEFVRLYDYMFKGCVSCFACHRKGSTTNGLCAYRDEITPALEKARDADVLILGSPVYFDYPTGVFRAFLERLMFPVDTYLLDENGNRQRFWTKTIPTGFIYTMNCPRDFMEQVHYQHILGANESNAQRLYGYSETLYSCDTYQFADYSKMECTMFDETKKREVRDRQFPIDRQKAYELGKRLAQKAREKKA